MNKRIDLGEGDVCPQDPTHGHMWAYPMTQRQYCSHSGHKGWPVYGWDGVTPAFPPAVGQLPAVEPPMGAPGSRLSLGL